jgi:hypothetical protein
MVKFQPTTLEELQIGDRFYFIADKYKKSHEVVKFFPGKTDRAEVQKIFGDKQVVSACKEVVFLNTKAERAAEKK